MHRVYHNKRFRRHNVGKAHSESQQYRDFQQDIAILRAMGCSRLPWDVNMDWYRQEYHKKFGDNPKFLFTYTGYIDKGE